MPNRLATETSPYLLQHADNPVDWYPWGREALERARSEDKPILLSIGYAACHWCHVMAHESFEDPEVARIMNELFVNIKVDREERPDIDSIYMQAVQAMTGHGGWPMTMFLTPEGVPFYGGTYFPPSDRHGIPSFTRILTSVGTAYRDQRGRVTETVDAMRRLYDDGAAALSGSASFGAHNLELAFRALSRGYDYANGGFGGAPKFPPTMVLEFLLRYWRRSGNDEALRMVHDTFLRMSRGGIYDQIAGGFARYSVDARWIVPHFEKMLYDNALLIRLGARLYRATKDEEVRRVTEQTIRWCLSDLRSPDGAFYSSYDADSEGEEGLFYVWSEHELREVLGEDAPVVLQYFGVTESGNFEGKNILTRPAADAVVASRSGITTEELSGIIDRARTDLLAVRAHRVPPGRDDKIIASWNGLMARALSEAAQAFDSDEFASASLRCSEFLFGAMTQPGAKTDTPRIRVLRTFNRSEARIPGFLEDHASLGLAAVSAYELTFDTSWLEKARALARSCVEVFSSVAPERNNALQFFDTAIDAEQLITRPRDVSDNAIPSGNSLVTELMLLMGEYFDDSAMTEKAEAVLASLADAMNHYPSGFGHMLCAADSLANGSLQVALVGDSPSSDSMAAMRRTLGSVYVPALILAGGRSDSGTLPLLAGKTSQHGEVTAYVCRRYVCEAPVTTADGLREQLESNLNASERVRRGVAEA